MDIEQNGALINPEMDVMTHEQQLDYTQSIRLNIVHQLAPNGVPPTDVKERRELLGFLESVDHQIHARRQSKADAKNADANERTANFLAELHKHKTGGFHRSDVAVIRDVTPDIVLDEETVITDYMLSQEANCGDTNFAAFSEQFKEENPEYK